MTKHFEFIHIRIYGEYSGSTKIDTHLDHMSHCKTTAGTNGLNSRTKRVCMIDIRRDEMAVLSDSAFEDDTVLTVKGKHEPGVQR